MDNITDIANALRAIMQAKKMSQNKLGKEIGISPAAITHIFKGDSDRIGERALNKVRAYLGRGSEMPLLKTHNVIAVWKLCDDARKRCRLLAVAADPGLGKTTSLEQYAKRNRETFYLMADVTLGARDFMAAIARAMGLTASGTANNIKDGIIAHLRECAAPLLIIDEVGKLKDTNWRMLQVIRDHTKDHAGIVISGTLYAKTYVDKMAAKDKMGFREIKSRIGHWLSLSAPTIEEVRIFSEASGIKNAEVHRLLHRLTKDFRSLSEVLKTLGYAAAENGEDINDPETVATIIEESN